MWGQCPRDDRPVEYMWCPLLNGAKFGRRPLLDCRAGTLVGRSSRYYQDMRRIFFPTVDTLVVKIQFEKLCDGAEIAIFASCICSEPRAAHFRPVS